MNWESRSCACASGCESKEECDRSIQIQVAQPTMRKVCIGQTFSISTFYSLKYRQYLFLTLGTSCSGATKSWTITLRVYLLFQPNSYAQTCSEAPSYNYAFFLCLPFRRRTTKSAQITRQNYSFCLCHGKPPTHTMCSRQAVEEPIVPYAEGDIKSDIL